MATLIISRSSYFLLSCINAPDSDLYIVGYRCFPIGDPHCNKGGILLGIDSKSAKKNYYIIYNYDNYIFYNCYDWVTKSVHLSKISTNFKCIIDLKITQKTETVQFIIFLRISALSKFNTKQYCT